MPFEGGHKQPHQPLRRNEGLALRAFSPWFPKSPQEPRSGNCRVTRPQRRNRMDSLRSYRIFPYFLNNVLVQREQKSFPSSLSHFPVPMTPNGIRSRILPSHHHPCHNNNALLQNEPHLLGSLLHLRKSDISAHGFCSDDWYPTETKPPIQGFVFLLTKTASRPIIKLRRRCRLIRKTVPYGTRSVPDARKAEGKMAMT